MSMFNTNTEQLEYQQKHRFRYFTPSSPQLWQQVHAWITDLDISPQLRQQVHAV